MTTKLKHTRQGMIGIIRIGLSLTLLTICSTTTIAQTKSIDKSLIEQLKWNDFLVIKVSHGAERYDRKEINVVYHQDSIVKIHSILKSNYSADKQIDTVFTLSGLQLTKLDKFGKDFNDKNIVGDQIWFAGTRTFYTIVLNGETLTFDDKSSYSLILDLLGK
jgi:hypothetical protein